MGPLIGRTNELHEGRALLEAARKQHVARLLRLAGVSGIGKTTIARALTGQAAADGWVAAFAAAHRIQTTLPLVFVRRLLGALVEALGDGGTRYTSGLDVAADDSLLRTLEAVLLDRPVLLVADDAQWADPESRRLLVRVLQALADRPLVLVSTERTDELDGQAFEFTDAAIVVDELDRASSESLARTLLPGAPDDVIRMIAEHGRGRAIDIVALSQSKADPRTMSREDVTATLRGLIARDLSLLDAEDREFLQMCSLISEPIDYTLLRQLWPEERRLLALIERFSGRYLVQRGDSLQFSHAAIGQSIRETIAIDVPYRRRIFEALRQLPTQRLEDHERLVEQARAMGDRLLEKTQLAKLVDEATRLQIVPAAARGIERLLAITPFKPEESLPLYSRLSILYNALSSDGDTHRVCAEALDLALSHGVKSGLGQLVLSDLFALFFRGERSTFDRTIARFNDYLESPEDCAYLAIGKLFRALCDFDDDAHDAAIAEFESLAVGDPTLQVRVDVFSGFHVARKGEIDRAFRMFDRARTNAQLLHPLLGVMVKSGELMLSFQAFGATHTQTLAALDAVRTDVATYAHFSALTMLLNGQFHDAIEIAAEALVHLNGTYVRRHLLGVAAMSAVLSGETLGPAIHAAIVSEASITLRDRIVGAQLPIATYAALSTSGSEAKATLRAIVDFGKRHPHEPMVVFFPLVLVKAAMAIGDAVMLETISRRELVHDTLALNETQYELAALSAQAALDKPIDRARAATLKVRFEDLGAPYFAGIAGELAASVSAPSESAKGLTRREREVAALVADGITNREIAERLVLSERTIEAHLANIFSKVRASSRAQVAVWYARSGLAATGRAEERAK